MKNISLMAIVLSAGIALGVEQGKSQEEALKGPIIKLENVEITLFDEKGKVIKKICATEEEKEKILGEMSNNVFNKVFKKLGIKDIDELYEKGLGGKYEEELDKICRVKELEQPKLKFIDKDGKVFKEILLGQIYVKKEKKKHPRLTKPHLIKESLLRYAIVSKNGKYAAIFESISHSLLPETKEEEKAMMDTDIGYLSTVCTIKYFDASGNILWEKQLPTNMEPGSIKISDNGEIIAYRHDYIMGGLNENEPGADEICVIYNKAGEKLFKLPEKKEDLYKPLRISEIDALSPKGRYVSIAGYFGYGKEAKPFILFIDLQNKTSYEFPSKYNVVNKIEDNGIAYTSYYDENEKKWKYEVIDLKKYLGE